MKEFSRTDYIMFAIFLSMLIPTAMMQTMVKHNPQIFMIGIGIISILTFLGKQHKAFTVTLYIILGLVIYIGIFQITNWIIDIVSPDRGWYIDPETGQRHMMQDPSFLLGVFIGIILTPILIWLYHKNAKRNRKLEIACVSIFTVMTVLIYLIYEIL